ncbi:cytochrome c [Geminicoccaceae bacterium 1502E]|nr:cytochrome c [Geminicoccaceae bacterium 1502E]
MQRVLFAAALVAMAAPLAAEAAGDPAAGRKKAGQCAACHGIDGVAVQPDAATIAGESEIYLTRQLEAFRAGERQHEQMTIIAQGLSDEDIADLVAWYSSIEFTVKMK